MDTITTDDGWKLPRDFERIVREMCGDAIVLRYGAGTGWCVSVGGKGGAYGRAVFFTGTKRECQEWARKYRETFAKKFLKKARKAKP